MKLSDVSPVGLAMAAGVGVALVVLWQAKKAAGAVVDAVRDGAISPTSTNNLAYKGTNAVGSAVTGDKDFSLGAWLFEVMNPGAVAAEKAAIGGSSTSTSSNPAGPTPAPSWPTSQGGPSWSDVMAGKGWQYGGTWGI